MSEPSSSTPSTSNRATPSPTEQPTTTAITNPSTQNCQTCIVSQTKSQKLREDNRKLKNLIKLAKDRIESQEKEIDNLTATTTTQKEEIKELTAYGNSGGNNTTNSSKNTNNNNNNNNAFPSPPTIDETQGYIVTKILLIVNSDKAETVDLSIQQYNEYGEKGQSPPSSGRVSPVVDNGGFDIGEEEEDFGVGESSEIHVLFEYTLQEEDDDDKRGGGGSSSNCRLYPHRRIWKTFASQSTLNDYCTSQQLKRGSSPPYTTPSPLLTEIESDNIREECVSSVRFITEEYRRYRVRAEVFRKELEGRVLRAERKIVEVRDSTGDINGGIGGNEGAVESNGSSSSNNANEIQTLKTSLANQESQWKEAYDQLLKENELLKSDGAEAALAKTWKLRYIKLEGDNEELRSKLEMSEINLQSALSNQKGSGGHDDTDGYSEQYKNEDGSTNYAEKYQALRDEYALYRKEAKRILETLKGGGNGGGGVQQSSSSSSKGRTAMSNQDDTTLKKRLSYLTAILTQYLSASDPAAKTSMEPAIFMALELDDYTIREIRKANDAANSWF